MNADAISCVTRPVVHLRNRVNGTPSFEVVGHHLKRLMVDQNFGIRIGSGSEHREGCGFGGLHGKKPQHARIRTPDGLPRRRLGAQLLRKIAILLGSRRRSGLAHTPDSQPVHQAAKRVRVKNQEGSCSPGSADHPTGPLDHSQNMPTLYFFE